ncbi:hypothetical protein ACP275_04G139600 [Erythranthe tilingii]
MLLDAYSFPSIVVRVFTSVFARVLLCIILNMYVCACGFVQVLFFMFVDVYSYPSFVVPVFLRMFVHALLSDHFSALFCTFMFMLVSLCVYFYSFLLMTIHFCANTFVHYLYIYVYACSIVRVVIFMWVDAYSCPSNVVHVFISIFLHALLREYFFELFGRCMFVHVVLCECFCPCL